MTVRGKVLDDLERKILQGELNFGEIIPSERELAAEYGVGRASIREALRELNERGLLVIRPGRGTFVSRPDSSKAITGIALWATRFGVTPADVLEARIGLESFAAARAAEHGGQEAELMMSTVLAELEKEKDPSRLARLDVAFHLLVARLSGNPLYELILTSLAPLTADLVASTADDPEILKRRSLEHRRIADAITLGDSQGAKAAMIDHLSAGEDILDHFFEPMTARESMRETPSLDLLLEEEGLGTWLQSEAALRK